MNAHDLINGMLKDFSISTHVFNPWSSADAEMDIEPRTAAKMRRLRLEQHLDCAPRFMLIGEAPGYQGCHFSGVAFTNEKLLLDGAIPRVTVRGAITRKPTPYSEPSATIVWRELHRLNIAERTIMWNAFAWHPHKPDELLSNRAPTQFELFEGAHVLRAMLDIFQGVQVIAVGKVAEWTLTKLGVKMSGKVRHPSMGGATQFRTQLAELCGAQTLKVRESA